MADRSCERCGKTFKYPAHLRDHLNRKTPCALIIEAPGTDPPRADRTCRFCGRTFSAYDAMRRHVRQNCKIAPNSKNGDAGMEKLYAHTLQKQDQEQSAKIERLEAKLEAQTAQTTEILALLRQKLGPAPAALQAGEVAIQGDHAQVDNSKKIVINVFGQEKLDHVTAEQVRTILDECLQSPALPQAADEAVLKAAMLVYSDPDRPENLTAYLPNKKTKEALVHTEAGWEVQPTRLVLPPMALKSLDTLFGKQPPEGEYAPLLKELQQTRRGSRRGKNCARSWSETRTCWRGRWPPCR